MVSVGGCIDACCCNSEKTSRQQTELSVLLSSASCKMRCQQQFAASIKVKPFDCIASCRSCLLAAQVVSDSISTIVYPEAMLCKLPILYSTFN